MAIRYPDYENCITNLTGAVLKEFGIASEAGTLPVCEELFQKEYKNIVVLLLDGMGMSILEKNLTPGGFFRKHLACEYSSVFPPTTVAATTSIDSGKNPAEHGWLGWDCYYKELDQNVTVFRNTLSGTEIPAADFPVAQHYCGYDSVIKQIRIAGEHAYYASPFAEPFPGSFAEVCERIRKLCEMDHKKYIYAYWPEPDGTMHAKGCFHRDSVEVLKDLEKQVKKLCRSLEDTLLLITADHGHMDSKGAAITEYPELLDCLVRMPSIEPRALNLFVKEEKREFFEKEFQKNFGETFLLLTKEEVKAKKLFGPGKEHPRFDEMLGDYLAVAVGDLSIYNSMEEKEHFVGVHAGLTEEEMRIPLIVIEKK